MNVCMQQVNTCLNCTMVLRFWIGPVLIFAWVDKGHSWKKGKFLNNFLAQWCIQKLALLPIQRLTMSIPTKYQLSPIYRLGVMQSGPGDDVTHWKHAKTSKGHNSVPNYPNDLKFCMLCYDDSPHMLGYLTLPNVIVRPYSKLLIFWTWSENKNQ